MSQIKRRIEAAADVIDMSFSAEHTQLEYGEFCRAVAASALEASGYEADLRDAVEALREIVALDEREGDGLAEGPGYWGAIGECAAIARRALGGQ